MRFRYFIAKGRHEIADRTLYPGDEVPAGAAWPTIDRDVTEGRVTAVPILDPEPEAEEPQQSEETAEQEEPPAPPEADPEPTAEVEPPRAPPAPRRATGARSQRNGRP